MVNHAPPPGSQALRWVLLALFCGYAITFSGRQLMAIAVEPLRQDFALSDTALGLVNGPFFALAFALMALPMGQLAGQINRRLFVALALLAWGLVSMGIASAHGLWILLMARLIHAALEAGLTPASMSLVAELAPPQRQAAAMGTLTMAPTLSAVLSLALGGWLVGLHGWRPIFWGVAILAILASALCWAALRDRPHQKAPPVVSVLQQTLRSTLHLLANPRFRWLALAAGLNTLGGYSLAMWNAAFLVRSHGFSLADAGLISGFGFGLPSALGMIVGAALTDRRRARNPDWTFGVSCWGIALGVLTSLAYFLWPTDLGLEWGGRTWPLGIAFGACSAFFSVWWTAETFSTAAKIGGEPSRPAAIAALSSGSTLVGIGVGPVLVGVVSDGLSHIGAPNTLGLALALSALAPLASVFAFRMLKPPQSGHLT